MKLADLESGSISTATYQLHQLADRFKEIQRHVLMPGLNGPPGSSAQIDLQGDQRLSSGYRRRNGFRKFIHSSYNSISASLLSASSFTSSGQDGCRDDLSAGVPNDLSICQPLVKSFPSSTEPIRLYQSVLVVDSSNMMLVTSDADLIPTVLVASNVESRFTGDTLRMALNWFHSRLALSWSAVPQMRSCMSSVGQTGFSSDLMTLQQQILQATASLQSTLGFTDLGIAVHYSPSSRPAGSHVLLSTVLVDDLTDFGSMANSADFKVIPLTKVKSVAIEPLVHVLSSNSSSTPSAGVSRGRSSLSASSSSENINASGYSRHGDSPGFVKHIKSSPWLGAKRSAVVSTDSHDALLRSHSHHLVSSLKVIEPGLYLAYLQATASPVSLDLLVSAHIPSMLPHARIRSRPARPSRSEIQAIQTGTGLQMELASQIDRASEKLLDSIMHLDSRTKAQCSIVSRPVHIADDITLLVVVPSEVCRMDTSSPKKDNSSDVSVVSLAKFESMNMLTYQAGALKTFGSLVCVLDLQISLLKHQLRESLDDSHATKQGLAHLEALKAESEAVYGQFRWITNLIRFVRQESESFAKLNTLVNISPTAAKSLKTSNGTCNVGSRPSRRTEICVFTAFELPTLPLGSRLRMRVADNVTVGQAINLMTKKIGNSEKNMRCRLVAVNCSDVDSSKRILSDSDRLINYRSHQLVLQLLI